jgi:hypothetical protein
MNDTVTKVFPAVLATMKDRAAYEAIQLTATDAASLTHPAPKPTQQ